MKYIKTKLYLPFSSNTWPTLLSTFSQYLLLWIVRLEATNGFDASKHSRKSPVKKERVGKLLPPAAGTPTVVREPSPATGDGCGGGEGTSRGTYSSPPRSKVITGVVVSAGDVCVETMICVCDPSFAARCRRGTRCGL